MWNQLKLKNQTIQINRNGYIFQVDPDHPSVCYVGGGGGNKVQYIDPYAGTGVRELYKQITDWIGPQIGQGITPYAGQTVPGASQLQQMGFDAAGGLTPIATGGQQYFGDVLGQADPSAPGKFMGTAEQTLQNVLQPFDPKMLMESMEPARKFGMDVFKQDVAPWIAEKYFSGGEGGAGYRELGKAGGRLASGLSAQLASYIFPASEAQKGRQQTGVGQAANLAMLPGNILQQAGQVGGMGTDFLTQLLNIGGQQRQITGQQLGAEQQKWQQARPYNNPYLNFLGTALGQPPMDVLAQEQGPGLGSQLLGPLGSFVGSEAGSKMISAGMKALPGILMGLSDVRAKENFARIEDALDKVNRLKGLTYNFKNNGTRSAGIIAQELEKVLPEAVIEHHGVKFVRYDAVIGLLVNAINELDQKIEARNN